MYLQYGSYAHASGECSVVITREPIRPQETRRRGIMHRWEVSGMLVAADATAMTPLIQALEAAYAADKLDIGLYLPDGTATAHQLLSSQTVDGTRVTRQPSYQDGGGAQYSTHRTYSLTVEGEIPEAGAGLLGWSESINYRGTGGPNWGYLDTLNSLPQQQTFQQFTTVTITQSGEAVSYGGYHVPPGPIWPANEHGPSRNINYARPSIGSVTI